MIICTSVFQQKCVWIITVFFATATAMKLQEILFTKCIGKFMSLRTQINFHG